MAYGAAQVVAQDGKNEFNPVETGVTSLGIAPDARGASMGDLGAATEPDANSQFWKDVYKRQILKVGVNVLWLCAMGWRTTHVYGTGNFR